MDRVTLVNAWHDDNKGDSAIVLGTLGALRHLLADQARFALVAQSISDINELPHAYRHVRAEFDPLDLAPCLLTPMRYARTRAGLYLSALIYLCRFASEALLLTRQRTFGARLIAESKLVMSKGGHKLHVQKSNPIHFANLYSHLAPLILARHYDIPFVIWGHSLGPFNTPFSRRFTRSVLKDALCIGVRESLSKEVATQIGLPGEKVKQIPDPAFMITPVFSKRVEQLMEQHALNPNKFLVVTVRQWARIGYEKYHDFLDQMASLIKGLSQKGFVQRVAIVVHTLGPIPTENDYFASELLMARLKGLPVCLIYHDLSPNELCALYGQSKLMIGTRLHSVILSMAGGTPACAISYFGPKSHGIMRDMGLQKWVVPIERVEPDVLIEQITSADLDSLRAHINHQVVRAREDFLKETELLLKRIRE